MVSSFSSLLLKLLLSSKRKHKNFSYINLFVFLLFCARYCLAHFSFVLFSPIFLSFSLSPCSSSHFTSLSSHLSLFVCLFVCVLHFLHSLLLALIFAVCCLLLIGHVHRSTQIFNKLKTSLHRFLSFLTHRTCSYEQQSSQ